VLISFHAFLHDRSHNKMVPAVVLPEELEDAIARAVLEPTGR